MRRSACAFLWLAALAVPLEARAQGGDELPPPEFEGGDAPPTESPPEVEPEAAPEEEAPPAEEEAPPADAGGWQVPRLMVVAERRTPRRLEYQVRELMGQVGEVTSADDYEREARARGLPAATDAAFEALLPDRGLAMVVVVGQRRARGDHFLHVVYREGGYGMALLAEDHPISGDRLDEDVAQRIVAEARLALAAITRPRTPGGGSDSATPTVPDIIPGERRGRGAPAAPGTAVHIGIAAGIGIGMRSFEVPTEPGIVRLSTSPFPAALVRLVVDVEPEAQGRIALGGELRYLTSVGLRSTDMRTDGTERNTSSRSQRLDLEVHARYRLAEPLDAVAIGAGVGWGMRSFSSEAPVTLPDYTLGGIRLRGFAVLPLGDRLRIEVGPEAVWLLAVDDSLTQEGVSGSAVAVGAEGRVRIELFGAFQAEVSYRESHAFLSSERGDAGDVERWATAQIIYRP